MRGFSVSGIPPRETYEWLLYKHYARRIPSISYAFGLYNEMSLVGICTFGSPASPSLCIGVLGEENKDSVIELNRLCVDCDKKNITSWFVSQCIKLLPRPTCIVSYADTEQGHIGKIYQACNFIYTGLSDRHLEWYIDDSNKHSRHIPKISKRGDEWMSRERPRKHRYIYFIGSKKEVREMVKALKYPICHYPIGDTKRYDASFKPITQGVLF